VEVQWNMTLTIYRLQGNSCLVRREVSHSILITFDIPFTLVGLIRMYLSETYGKVCITKHLSDGFRSE
jgi:hypothetical protein